MTDPCAALAAALGEPVTLDPLAGSWKIFQVPPICCSMIRMGSIEPISNTTHSKARPMGIS